MKLLENLVGKSRKASRVGLLGLAIVGGGCSTNEARIIGGGILMGSDSKIVRLTGSNLYELGIMGHEKDLVRLGSTVNINVNRRADGISVPATNYAWANSNPNSDEVIKSRVHMFTSNYWADSNGDGFIELGEFAGRKTTFRDYERIMPVFLDETGLIRDMNMQVYSPRGEELASVLHNISPDAGGIGFVMNAPLIQEGGHGIYRIVWKVKVDGYYQYIGSSEFEIVPSNREENEK